MSARRPSIAVVAHRGPSSRTRAIGRGALLAAAVAAALLAGCGSSRPKPAPLVALTPKIAGRQVWSTRLDAVRFPLVLALAGGRVYAAASSGSVAAFDVDSGREIWRAQAGGEVAAGVGSDGRYASVVTRANEVVTFDDGKEVWRARVRSRVATPPLVAGERVFVLAVDRSVEAFDAVDGRRLWRLQRPGDPLTLAQPGVLAPFHNTLLVGQGPRLAGVDPLNGRLQWELPIASPRGTNEVERLADLVGPALRQGERVCARAFQAAVGCADLARGTVLWSRNVGGTDPVGGDAERIYGADAVDRVSAWKAETGDVLWTNEQLLNRGLSGVLAAGTTVVAGDREGYVHFLAAASGEMQLRLPTDGSAVVGTPVLAGTTILVATAGGGLYAFRPQ